MDAGIATQLITVGATLSGVVLTLGTNAYIEGRRARDTRALESMRLASEHARWLRDERMKVYAEFSISGEEVMQLIRSELPILLGPEGVVLQDDMEARWHQLRTRLRKACNQVELFGTDAARAAALLSWRTARNGVNDLFHDLGNDLESSSGSRSDMLERIRALASDFGTSGERFLEACRKDLQRN